VELDERRNLSSAGGVVVLHALLDREGLE
jgi:hypothetical protein